MKQKLLTLLVVFLTAVGVSAYDFEVDGIYYNTISMEDLTCEVTSGDTKYSGDVTQNKREQKNIEKSSFYSSWSCLALWKNHGSDCPIRKM